MLFPYSCMGSHLWEIVLHEHLQHESFPWDGVLQEQTALVWVPHGVICPARKPPLHGPQFLPGACSSMGSPLAAASFKAHPPAPAWGPPRTARGQPASPWSSLWAARESLLRCLEHLLPLLLLH